MAQNVCPQCGAPIELGATECKYCGEKLAVAQANQQVFSQPQPQPQIIVQQTVATPASVLPVGVDPSWPIKSKTVAGILAILLGGIGVHKFYLGKVGMGILYLLFCWTYVPALIGIVEGIIYLCANDHNFMIKHHVRLY